MHEKTPCLQCQRMIDAYAKLCPFCNYDQQAGPPPPPPPLVGPDGEVVEAAPPPPPPSVRNSRFSGKQLLVGLAVVLLLASTFAVGALVNVIGSRSRLAKEAERQEAERDARTGPPAAVPSRAESLGDLRLVPVDPSTTVGQSITSVPLSDVDQNIPQEFQRSDATALPSEQYSAILSQAQQAPAEPQQRGAVDPRTIPGGIEEIRRAEQARLARERARQQEAQRAATAPTQPAESPAAPAAEAEARTTRPVPVHQPLPEINAGGTMRFDLRIGTDGRVKEVRVLQSMPDHTARAVSAIQRWRFKPATRNGEPVEANFQVELSFNAP